MRKGDKNPKEERKTRPKTNREQKSVGTAGERTTTISGNITKPLQTTPKRNYPIPDHKAAKGSLSANMPIYYRDLGIKLF
jgi:hypothetical protein